MGAWFLVSVLVGAGPSAGTEATWRPIIGGVDYAVLPLAPKPAIGDGLVHVVRIDPARAELRAVTLSQNGGSIRTARQWRTDLGAAVVINAGMFAAARAERDFSTHVGFMRVGTHTNSDTWLANYQSVFLAGPRPGGKNADAPRATIVDLASGAGAADYADYDTVIQNLRLIRAPSRSVWKPNGKQWSEAAIALDDAGRVLFVFCRSPLTMADFNAMLIGSRLRVLRAMHAEGGPEASLSIKGNGVELDLAGSYETGFNENDDNDRQWPIPNVLAVVGKP